MDQCVQQSDLPEKEKREDATSSAIILELA